MNQSYKEQLISRLNNREAVIGIVGMGYVGLPLMLMYSNAGYRVVGVDIDAVKVDALNSGESYIGHIPALKIQQAKENGFKATTDFSEITQVDALILCVPTPLDRHREPDLSFVVSTLNSAVPFLKVGQVISLESTTYPGTTEEVLAPDLQQAGLTIGEDIFLVYSPEREDPGNPDFATQNIPKICSGFTENCLEVGMALYRNVVEQVVPVSSLKVAEMTKLLENIHRAVNIGLVNELKIVADRMGIDIHEVISAAATKPFGFTPYYPGPGLGGHCIPIDPFYLTWKAREFGLHTRFIELAGEVNTNMPSWVIGKTIDALNHLGKPLKGSRVLVLGIAYKKNVDDMRESPAVELMQLLKEKSAEVHYSDPHVLQFPKMRRYQFNLESTELTAEAIQSFDCVLLATDHDDFDYELIKQNARLIIDTRGVYKQPADNIVKA
jgi:UDP-N-acetyl-D-glucosamine dehydrogenase